MIFNALEPLRRRSGSTNFLVDVLNEQYEDSDKYPKYPHKKIN